MARSLGCMLMASVLFLFGCTSTQQILPRANQFKTSDEKAVITVERKYSRRGGMRQVTLMDNGQAVGKLGNCGRLTWKRPAGNMKLALKESFGMVNASVPPIEESVATGKIYKYYVVWDSKQNSFAVVSE